MKRLDIFMKLASFAFTILMALTLVLFLAVLHKENVIAGLQEDLKTKNEDISTITRQVEQLQLDYAGLESRVKQLSK